MANGVPVVLPAHGAFPELMEDTGGGLLHTPGDAASLAEALKRLILDPRHADDLGRRGRAAIHDRYRADVMAQRTVELYRSLCAPPAACPNLQPAQECNSRV
jgi:glycosyltransferase involved in cell wall biosynthesis